MVYFNFTVFYIFFKSDQVVHLRLDNRTSSYTQIGFLDGPRMSVFVSRQDDDPLTVNIWAGLEEREHQYHLSLIGAWTKKPIFHYYSHGWNSASDQWYKFQALSKEDRESFVAEVTR